VGPLVLGWLVGCADTVGSAVGRLLGCVDGSLEGCEEGTYDGAVEGRRVGFLFAVLNAYVDVARDVEV